MIMLVYINFNNHKFSVSLRLTLYVYIEGHFPNTRVLIVEVDMMNTSLIPGPENWKHESQDYMSVITNFEVSETS